MQSYTGYNPLASIFRTTGTRSIEERYSSGGAATTHTPGAGTPRGKPDQVDPIQSNPSGVGMDKFKETHGEQKPGVCILDSGNVVGVGKGDADGGRISHQGLTKA